MAEINHVQIYALANDIAAVVRREGQHDFAQSSAASLLGLSVVTVDGLLKRLHAADLDIVFDHRVPANDHDGAGYAACLFHKGVPSDLASWHRRLGGLNGFFTAEKLAG